MAMRLFSKLLQLLDWHGPSSYTGAAGRVVRVNAAETGVELHALAEVDVANLPTDLANLSAGIAASTPAARTISTTAPLTGGGDLSADRTLAISAATDSTAGSMSAADKTKLDAATASATVSTLSLRDANGDLSAATFLASPAILAGSNSGAAVTWGHDNGAIFLDGSAPAIYWNGEQLQWISQTVNGMLLPLKASQFIGGGLQITGIAANNVSLGVLNDSRLSINIPRLNTANTFTASNTFTQTQTIPTVNGSSSLNLATASSNRFNIDANGVMTGISNGSVYFSTANSLAGSIWYTSETNNVLWQADKRFDVVSSNFLAFTSSVPFDCDYSNFSGCTIGPGQVATVTITMAGTKGNPSNITYTEGVVYVTLYGGIYYGEFLGASSVRVRFLCSGTWSAWANGSNIQNGNPFYQNLWRVPTNSLGNFWTQMQIEITAAVNAGATHQWCAVTEIEYQATRPDTWMKQARFDKYNATETLYSKLQFSDSTGTVQASIDTSGIVTGQKLQIGGSTTATTPGAVVKKMPLYDSGGTLLGYLPIYSSIS